MPEDLEAAGSATDTQRRCFCSVLRESFKLAATEHTLEDGMFNMLRSLETPRLNRAVFSSSSIKVVRLGFSGPAMQNC